MSGLGSAPELARGIALGVALAASCGLRIFLPLLVVSVASLLGWVHLAGSLDWIGTAPALTVFLAATLVEVAAYHVPWLDNLLDHVGAPVAIVAGTLLAASVLPADDPVLRWTVAAVAGGGVAGTVHASMAVLRQMSSYATGGLANPVLALLETMGAAALAVIALVVPLLAITCGVVLVVGVVRLWRRRRRPVAAPPHS